MHFHKYSCEADVQKISSFFKTKQQFSCQKVCFKINVIQPKGFKKYVVHIVLAGNQTKDRCRTRAKNIPISIFAYCKNKPLCAILVSCRNPQVLFFALLQTVCGPPPRPFHGKKCNQRHQFSLAVWSKPDLDPNIRAAFSKHCFRNRGSAFASALLIHITSAVLSSLLVGEPPKRIQASICCEAVF